MSNRREISRRFFLRALGKTRSVLIDAELLKESKAGINLLGDSPDGGLDRLPD